MRIDNISVHDCVVDRLKSWARDRLPYLNDAALRGELSYEAFGDIATREVLVDLPTIERLDEDVIRPMLTVLGMLGSAIERHAQQQTLVQSHSRGYTFHDRRAAIEVGRGLDTLMVNGTIPFRDYFFRLADVIGHPHRDSLYSLMIWNGLGVTVYDPADLVDRSVVYRSENLFRDELLLSFTGKQMERYFLGVIKETVALQAAANQQIMQLCDPESDLRSVEMQTAARTAAQLIWAMQACMHRFMKRPDLDIDLFLDVIRQYDCPWHPPETRLRPVSVANDVHSLYRDVVLFDELVRPNPHFPGYRAHIQTTYCVMLPEHIAQLEGALQTETLETRLTTLLGDDQDNQSPDWIWAYVDLYNAQRDMSRAHYALVAKFLLQPSEKRKQNKDPREYVTVVDNSHGTTGMDPIKVVKYLDDARAAHPLTRFNGVKGRPKPAKLSHDQLLRLVEMG